MAAPHVSGVAALMLQANPQLSAQQLREILMDTSRDDEPAFDGYSVSGGRLNAAGAVAHVLAGGIPLDTDGDGVVDAADTARRSRRRASPTAARSTATATASRTRSTTAT